MTTCSRLLDMCGYSRICGQVNRNKQSAMAAKVRETISVSSRRVPHQGPQVTVSTSRLPRQIETQYTSFKSKRFFAEPLKATGAQPLLWSTGLMSPEAYTLDAAIQGWVRNETGAQVRERAAQAYHQWQKCGISGARRLLVTGW